MQTKEIEIPEYVSILCQKYDLEQSSRREIIKFIFSQNLSLLSSKIKKYIKDYDKKLFIFNQIKKAIFQFYIKPYVKNQSNYSWSLDYNNNIITLNFLGEK